MSRDKMMSISKISNGFIIQVDGRFKRKKEKEGNTDHENTGHMSDFPGFTEEELFAKDGTDLAQKIESLIPLLEVDEFESEDAFDKAFNEAAKK